MQKVKLITDSASDVSDALAAEKGIHILGFEITIDGETYRERENLTNEQFYKLLSESDGMPKTAALMPPDFIEEYEKAYAEGYTDVLYISIASTGSGTHNYAKMAVDEFYGNHPELKEKFGIYVVDGKNYSVTYGYAVVQAANMLKKGVALKEIVDFVEDWAACAEIYFAPFTLKYVRKSGRLSAAAAFAGELLGLLPIIGLIDAVSSVQAKVRGSKNVIPKLVQVAEDRMIPKSPYCLIAGSSAEHNAELLETVTKKFNAPPEYVFQLGPTICAHAGHDVIGVMVRGELRN